MVFCSFYQTTYLFKLFQTETKVYFTKGNVCGRTIIVNHIRVKPSLDNHKVNRVTNSGEISNINNLERASLKYFHVLFFIIGGSLLHLGIY